MNEKAETNGIYVIAVEKFAAGNYSECVDEFLALSHGGDARASLYAATIFDRGGAGVIRDLKRARDLYKQSLSQSYVPGAALGLAMILYKGRGGMQDFEEAARYFKMLRDNAFSQIMLGIMALNGNGCLRSEKDALAYFDTAWSLGHPLGLKNAAIVRFNRGQRVRGTYDFFRSFFLILWVYGIKRVSLISSPRDRKTLVG